MKHWLILILLACLWGQGNAAPSAYRELASINRYWTAQQDIPEGLLPAWSERSDKAWIRLHLELVEQVLRRRSTAGLTARQQQHRARALDYLNGYHKAGNFPRNEVRPYRTPVFIDAYDNFCAVGYLLKATGHEAISRKIAATGNLAYVMDMTYPELADWAGEYGFTREELAWIQPTYPPLHYTMPVGDGTNGDVLELAVSADGDRLYAGGTFTVAGNVPASHIAFLTRGGANDYTWHALEQGINGPVHAICEFQGKVFAGGAFTEAGSTYVNNIAYWENNSWHNAGCLYGVVNDLLVYDNKLYAAGDFDVCAGSSEVNFARWDGTNWQPLAGLTGSVHTLEVAGGRLLLGGDMTYNGTAAPAIAWSPATGFATFSTDALSPVNDFTVFKGKVYAACTLPGDGSGSGVLMQLDGNAWAPVYESFEPFMPFNEKLSLNTLLIEGDNLVGGGSFIGLDMMEMAMNCKDVTPPPFPAQQKQFYIDDEMYKMVWFKNDLIAGGRFRNGLTPTGEPIPVGGIARRAGPTSGITPHATASWRLYPNPIGPDRVLTLEGNTGLAQLKIYDITGRQLFSKPLQENRMQQQVQLPALAPAVYLVELSGTRGERFNTRMLLR